MAPPTTGSGRAPASLHSSSMAKDVIPQISALLRGPSPEKQMAAALMAYNLATAEQVQQLSDAANTPQVISTDQVSAAMAPHRGGT